jgi:hypothetical protein
MSDISQYNSVSQLFASLMSIVLVYLIFYKGMRGPLQKLGARLCQEISHKITHWVPNFVLLKAPIKMPASGDGD